MTACDQPVSLYVFLRVGPAVELLPTQSFFSSM